MGFTLQIAKISSLVDVATAVKLNEFLKAHSKVVNENINEIGFSESFPFLIDSYEEDDWDEESPDKSEYILICHQEVGWSWWDATVNAMEATLGTKGVEHISFLEAWYGVALPFDIPNQHLIKQNTKGMPFKARVTVAILSLFVSKNPKNNDSMISLKGEGEVARNLRMVSSKKILAELEAACKAWGLPEDEMLARTIAQKMYDDMPEDNLTISRCYALMVRSFLRYAIANNHLVWLIK